MSDYFFISIVGTQIFGTLNPLLSLLAEGFSLRCVHLLVTNDVLDTAQKIELFCREYNLNVEIDIVEPTADSVRCALNELSKKMSANEGYIFNINGGTNQMIVGCSLALYIYKPFLIQSTEYSALLTDTKTWKSRYCAAPEKLSASALLSLQGIGVTHSFSQEKTLGLFCERGHLSFPSGALKDINIGGIDFDMIWNRGNNRLTFLWSGLGEKGRDLTLLRNLSHWAGTRERSEHLFDRKVIAVLDNPNAIEHLKAESNGKIEVQDVQGWKENAPILRSQLEINFQSVKWIAPRALQPKKRNPISFEPDTLVLMLGKDPSATLLCIASHTPQHVVLCYTDELKESATRIREMVAVLGLKSLRLVPCEHTGFILSSCLAAPKYPETVHVNITPGLKGQGVFLSLWAARHGCPIWAIDHGTQSLIRLDTQKPLIPLRAPDPLTVMNARGDTITTEEMKEDEIWGNDRLLAFLQKALHNARSDDIFKQSVKIDDETLYRSALKNWELHLADGSVFQFTMAGGEWLELLAARAFELAGAKHVHVRVRRNGSEERTQAILKKHGEGAATFLSDMDVVGAFESGFFLVSCKSNSIFTIDNAAMEARDMSKSVDRFTVPFLCHLGCNTPFQHERSKTLVFGWRELCQPDILRRFLREQREEFKKINR